MEDKFEVLELEDGTNYIVVDTAIINNIKYAYMINEKDKTDVMFQRISYDSELPQLSPVESDEEFNTVLMHFAEKYQDLLED